MRLDGKVALVTGGARGLGKAIARRFASEGGTIVITDVLREIGEATAKEHGFTFIEHDVTKEKQWTEVIDHIEGKHGALHILVNNAGIIGNVARNNPETVETADWEKVQAVNVEGVVLGCRAAIPLMRRTGGGSIINMASVAADSPGPDSLSYATSKAAVRQITISVALYCAKSGSKIRCNSIHPGLILTDMPRNGAEGLAKARGVSVDDVVAGWLSSIPQGEFIEPEDIANAALFLASDESKRITGARITVDGGQMCKY